MNFKTTPQVRRELGLTQMQLYYTMGVFKIEPAMIGGRRLWTDADVEAVRLGRRELAGRDGPGRKIEEHNKAKSA